MNISKTIGVGRFFFSLWLFGSFPDHGLVCFLPSVTPVSCCGMQILFSEIQL